MKQPNPAPSLNFRESSIFVSNEHFKDFKNLKLLKKLNKQIKR